MHIQAMIHHYGYAGVFLILMMEMIGIPFPAETTLTISGFEWTQGAFRLVPLLLAASVGNIVGSTIAYAIGRFLGRPIIVKFGRFIGITNERLDKANQLFAKFQSPVVLFGKFIAGVRVLIPYLAGINKMSFGLFSLYNAVSAVLWAGLFIVLGRYIGVEWRRYHQVLHQYMLPTILVVVVLVAAYAALRIWRHKRQRRSI